MCHVIYDAIPYDAIPYDVIPYDVTPYDVTPYDVTPYDVILDADWLIHLSIKVYCDWTPRPNA